MQQSNNEATFTRGWEIVKALNSGVSSMSGLEARNLLAEYAKMMQLPTAVSDGARHLHSAILSCAVKMAKAYPDFHFVSFLNLWGLEHLRPEDSEARVDEEGKRIPSLVERMAKAYVYSMLFHPTERLDAELESLLLPYLYKKGYGVENSAQDAGQMGNPFVCTLLATRTFVSDVRGRKMTFVSLIDAQGTEYTAEVHTITAYGKMRYNDIPGSLYDVLPRLSETGKSRIEAAVLSKRSLQDIFPLCVGYVEHIDLSHRHIHVFDNKSRHFVANQENVNSQFASLVREGSYVEFAPVIPIDRKFKSAILTSVISAEDGPVAFGIRKAKVTFVEKEKGYASWELLPGEAPIEEAGISDPSFTKGYLRNLSSADFASLSADTMLSLVVFLKRGKDKKKYPYVVRYQID